MRFSLFFLIFLFLLFFPITVVASSSVIAMDIDSGRILYEDNANEEKLIASTTKVMTAIIAIEEGKLHKKVTVGEEVLKMYGTNIYVEVGEKISLLDLLYGLLLRSGNDASVVIAKAVAESEEEFVKLMNAKAKELGMKDTVFENPHGLDEYSKNYSTAYDMALLSAYAFHNKTYRKIVSTKKYECNTGKKTYLWYNRNQLLFNYKYCTGGKNGYTPAAGKSLVSTATKNNFNITIVSLNDGNIYGTHENLYEKLFDKYKRYKIIDKDNFNIDENLFSREVYIKRSFYYPLMEDEINHVKTIVALEGGTDSRAGNINIFLDDKKIGTLPIYYVKKREKTKSPFQKFLSLFWW